MLLCSLLQLLIIWYKFFHFIFIQCFCSKVEHKSLFLRDLIYFHYFVVFNRQNAWFQAISDGQNFYCYIIQISQIAVFLFLFPYSTATNTWSKEEGASLTRSRLKSCSLCRVSIRSSAWESRTGIRVSFFFLWNFFSRGTVITSSHFYFREFMHLPLHQAVLWVRCITGCLSENDRQRG